VVGGSPGTVPAGQGWGGQAWKLQWEVGKLAGRSFWVEGGRGWELHDELELASSNGGLFSVCVQEGAWLPLL
jgi:hypothetical protein